MAKYDNISIRRLPSGSYQYRVRDRRVSEYEAATFVRTDEDARRDKPGTAAGDRWAKAQLARFRLGQATAEAAALDAVVGDYLADLRSRRRRGKPLTPTHVRDVERTLASLVTACPGLDLNRPTIAARAIKGWWDGLQAAEVKVRALELLARHLGILHDRIEVDVVTDRAEALAKARARVHNATATA